MSPWLIGTALLLLITVVAAVTRERANNASAQAPGSTVVATGGPVETAVSPDGTPILVPVTVPTWVPGEPTPDFRLPPDSSQSAPGIPALQPDPSDSTEFAEQDVIAYLAEEPHFFADPQGPAPEVVSMQVLPAIEAAYVVLGNVGRPDDAPVLVVELRGDFARSGPPGSGIVKTAKASFMVFDAITGNLLQVTMDDINRLE